MRLWSFPVERIAHFDMAGAHSKCEAHILKLENGQYALVIEEGCSCYEPKDAEIELFPTRPRAKEALDRWVRERREI
jgi:hypothetical protein